MPQWNSGTSFLPVMEEGELVDPHDEDGELRVSLEGEGGRELLSHRY